MNDNSLLTTRDSANLPALVPATVYSPEYSFQPQPGSLLDYWSMIWRRRMLFVGCTCAGLIVALGIALPQSPVYRAHTTLEIQDLNNDFVNMKLASPIAESSPMDSLTDIQTQIRILQSDSLIDRSLEKANIRSAADLNPHQRDLPNWASMIKLPGSSENRETLTETAGRSLKVAVIGQTRIVDIAFDATDPELAARFVNTLTSEFINRNMETRWQMNRQTSEWLAGQLAELRTTLERSDNALQEYARRKSLIYTADKQTISSEKLRQLQAELSKAQADRVEKQSRFEMARAATPETLPDVLNDANLRSLESGLSDLRRQEAEIGVTFTGDYAKAKKLSAGIAAMETAVRQKRAAIVSRIANELTEAERREQLLTSAYTAQTLRVTDDSAKSIQYDGLKREVDTNRQIYEGMLQRVKESAIASALKASNVRVIDSARPPLHPYKPNLPVDTAAGLLAGALFGVVAIVVRTRMDASVREPGDAGLLLGIPELGVIPKARGGRGTSSVITLVAQPRQPGSAKTNRMVPSSNSLAIADSFRAVLASIFFSGAQEARRVLVITSAGRGEGKTTAAANLAVTLANMGRRVLLIDADIRSPRVHQIFGLDNSKGVTDLLRTASAGNLIETLIQTTASPNLRVLPSGPGAAAGADLLFSQTMAALIARCREQFDMVLIDTPPMLSMPDARVLGRIADGVVLIARAGKTSRAAVQAAFHRLVEDQITVLGVILNDWNAQASSYGYYAAYKYSDERQATGATRA